jgi:hypothetical protein
MVEMTRDPHLDPIPLIFSMIVPHLDLINQESPELFSTPGDGDDHRETELVNAADWMNQLVKVTRAYEAAHQLVQSQDELLGQTLASFGRL